LLFFTLGPGLLVWIVSFSVFPSFLSFSSIHGVRLEHAQREAVWGSSSRRSLVFSEFSGRTGSDASLTCCRGPESDFHIWRSFSMGPDDLVGGRVCGIFLIPSPKPVNSSNVRSSSPSQHSPRHFFALAKKRRTSGGSAILSPAAFFPPFFGSLQEVPRRIPAEHFSVATSLS